MSRFNNLCTSRWKKNGICILVLQPPTTHLIEWKWNKLGSAWSVQFVCSVGIFVDRFTLSRRVDLARSAISSTQTLFMLAYVVFHPASAISGKWLFHSHKIALAAGLIIIYVFISAMSFFTFISGFFQVNLNPFTSSVSQSLPRTLNHVV